MYQLLCAKKFNITYSILPKRHVRENRGVFFAKCVLYSVYEYHITPDYDSTNVIYIKHKGLRKERF